MLGMSAMKLERDLHLVTDKFEQQAYLLSGTVSNYDNGVVISRKCLVHFSNSLMMFYLRDNCFIKSVRFSLIFACLGLIYLAVSFLQKTEMVIS